MKIAVLCYSDAGCRLARRIQAVLLEDEVSIHSIPKYALPNGFVAHRRLSFDMEELFSQYQALVFLSAVAVAVRSIAPHIQSKEKDPAVLAMDDLGTYVIPILSGHIGGANALAKRIAALVGALPIITTATDLHGRFSCDAFAASRGLFLSSLEIAKEVSAAILVRDIPVCSEYSLPERLPEGLFPGDCGEVGIYIGVFGKTPFKRTLRLVPRVLTAGIGCRRGTDKETLRSALLRVMDRSGMDMHAICQIASVDLKKDEPGLLSLAGELGVPAVFFSAEELEAAPGAFAESAFVRKTVGTGNVCERAAVLAGGELVVQKCVESGVTVAVSRGSWEIVF